MRAADVLRPLVDVIWPMVRTRQHFLAMLACLRGLDRRSGRVEDAFGEGGEIVNV